MVYLLTWSEGEEVNYRFLNRNQLKGMRFEHDKKYTLTEIHPDREFMDFSKKH